MNERSDKASIAEFLKEAFPAYLVMRGLVFAGMIAITAVGGFGWVMHTTLNGYNIAFETMLARMASMDGNVAEVRQISQDVDKRTSEMSTSLSEIKRMVGNNGQSISYYRDELNDVRKSLTGNREKTAHLLGMIERIQADMTESAVGLN